MRRAATQGARESSGARQRPYEWKKSAVSCGCGDLFTQDTQTHTHPRSPHTPDTHSHTSFFSTYLLAR